MRTRVALLTYFQQHLVRSSHCDLRIVLTNVDNTATSHPSRSHDNRMIELKVVPKTYPFYSACPRQNNIDSKALRAELYTWRHAMHVSVVPNATYACCCRCR
jgi:hypothetical protein